MYRERPSVLRHTVAWSSAATGPAEDHRVLPDGCMDLLWHRGELVVAGPDTTAHISTWTAAAYTALRFGAGIGPRVVGIPAVELRDQRIPLADLWPLAEVRRATERVAAASRPDRALEALATQRLRSSDPPDPLGAYLLRRFVSRTGVATLADDAGMSTRQLHRRTLNAFGYGPKTLERIVRLNRALDLCRDGLAHADAAVMAGYADQPHLAREVKALAGVPLTTVLA